MCGEHLVERVVGERQCQCVGHHGHPMRQPRLRQRHHGRALVRADDHTAKVTGQEAAAAGDVDGARGGEAGNEFHQAIDFGAPPGSVAIGELPLVQVPLVVLAGALVVVACRCRIAGECR